MKTTKTNGSTNTNLEATVIKLFINDSEIVLVEKFSTRSLYKMLREKGYLPTESVGKTSSVISDEGKSVVVSFKDIEVNVDVDFDYVLEEEEIFLVASKEAQAAASVPSYGLSTNFGIVTSREIFFMEKDEESGKNKMSGAEVHTAAYLAQLDKKAKKRAAQLAKSKELYNENVVKGLKKLNIDVKDLSPEVVTLIAEQILDLESAGNAYLHDDTQDLVKVKVQRFNPETGRWYNAKNKAGRPMVELFPSENIFEYDQDGRIIGMKMMAHGQTAIAHALESQWDLTCVHNYHYIDKETNELVFKSIEQRFILSGKVINSSASIDGSELEATMPISNWSVNKEGEIVESFQFFGFDNLVDVAEGFYLMPSMDEEYGADMDAADYEEGIMYGTSKGTVAMSVNDQAKAHIKANRQENAEIEKVGRQARRSAQTKKDSKSSKREAILKSGLYQWALENQELTFDARKNAKLQNDLNAKFNEMMDEADDLLEVLAVLKEETGKGFAHPSWIVINALAKKPKKDSNKAFAAQVEEHIRSNIDAINNGSLSIKDMDDELLAEIYSACLKYGKKANCWIADSKVAVQIRDRSQSVNPIALPKEKAVRNGSVKSVDVADYYMSNKVS